MAVALNKQAVRIDVYANTEVSSVVLVSVVNFERVYAFESLLNDSRWYRKNIIHHEIQNVEVAIGDFDKTQTISLANTNNGIYFGGAMITNSSSINRSNGDVQLFSVQQVSNNSWAQKEHIKKIDIEGYEYAALLGAKQTINQYNPILLNEFYPRKISVYGSVVPRKLINILFRFYKHIFMINRITSQLKFIDGYADIQAKIKTNHGAENLISFLKLCRSLITCKSH